MLPPPLSCITTKLWSPQDRLDAAEAVRAAAAAARQRRAAAAVRRAADVRAAVEARAAEEARQKEAALNARLSRAAATRWASLAAKVSSQPEVSVARWKVQVVKCAPLLALVVLSRFWFGIWLTRRCTIVPTAMAAAPCPHWSNHQLHVFSRGAGENNRSLAGIWR